MSALPSLAADFPTPELEAWEALVLKGLKGAGFEERLVAHTEDGLRIEPLYTRRDELPEAPPPGQAPWLRGTAMGRTAWDIRARCTLADLIAANRAILADLAGGAGSVVLAARGRNSADLRQMLDGVLPELAPVHLERDPGEPLDLPAGVLVELDPLEPWARGDAADPDETARHIVAAGLAGRDDVRFALGGPIFDDAGASDAEEIGLTIALAVDLTRRLEEVQEPGRVLERAILRVTTSADFFGGIAKLRALRRLWGRVAEILELPALRPTVHATSSARMLTRYDRWTNLLRNTIAAAAAGLGGADAVTVLPHDHACTEPDPFAARMARNIQNVLLEESRLGLVADPAGGSWHVEQLSEQLAEAGWAVLQRVEAAGGMAAACRAGLVEDLLAERRASRRTRVATRRRPILGVSLYPDAGEREVPPKRDQQPGRRLPRIRDAQELEDLRDRVLQAGLAPVPVLTLGPAARHTGRLGFAQGLLAAAGLEAAVIDRPDAVPPEARLVLIAGDDADYAEGGVAAVRRLRETGINDVHLMGQPRDVAPALAEAGVGRFVRQGDDLMAYLEDVVEQLR
ncbi:MAG TPA: methylmalonyl-CoA mutase family protein [Geminicoccus sp.]|uniref:methylmalonyl-CoA mutase family protein n=1 Tax=Geminicoccus sp. TaxID=2024832 RepID=UPI002CF81944|nr:methylmalonyl-CoA mutase family protein [Geminicoccus sp.]HWL67067.1 methylmalonyl-CoA mutase family protein [Geminicoccus sp.]